MNDTIYRQAAIEELESAKVYMTAYKDGVSDGNIFAQYNRGLSDGIDRLKQLPAAGSVGRWVSVGCVVPSIANVPMIKRTVCGHLEPDVDVARTPYCSHCGAYMKGEEDD